MIICHTGFTADPLNNIDRLQTIALSAIQGQSLALYADATDTEDPNATFTFAWQVLNLRTGQTATLTDPLTATPHLQGFSGVWGDIRVFCVATNTSSSATSESDPLLAPSSAFSTVALTSAERTLTRPAIGSRDWYTSQDALYQTVEDLELPIGIDSATVNGGGDLILTMTDGSTINAGAVVGPAGADGADGVDGVDGADGAAGPSVHEYAYTSTVTHWWDQVTQTLQAGFNPTKTEVIAGPWIANTDLDILRIHASVRDMGNSGNSVTFEVFSCTANGWRGNPITTTPLLTATIPPTSSANIPETTYTTQTAPTVVTAGDLFGVMLTAPLDGPIQQIAVDVYAREV